MFDARDGNVVQSSPSFHIQLALRSFLGGFLDIASGFCNLLGALFLRFLCLLHSPSQPREPPFLDLFSLSLDGLNRALRLVVRTIASRTQLLSRLVVRVLHRRLGIVVLALDRVLGFVVLVLAQITCIRQRALRGGFRGFVFALSVR
jgi:hypothetical protein